MRITVLGLVAACGSSAARMSDGTVRCWGGNSSGDLGDGTTTERHTPVQVKGLAHAVDVQVGLASSCAVVAGLVRCGPPRGIDVPAEQRHVRELLSEAVEAAVRGDPTASMGNIAWLV